MTEIQYEVREKDLIAFNEHLLANSESLQKTIRRHQAIIPGVIAAIALLLFFYFKDIPSAIYVILIAMGWGLGVPFYLKWNIRKQLSQIYTDKEKANIIGHYTLRSERESIVEIGASGESKLPWNKVLRIEVEKKYVFIFVSLNSALIIPRATLTKESNLHEFVKSVDERIEMAG
ncbi:MAG: YcxB family protein [Candidatus Methylumidiphilus sp.]